MKPLSLVAVVLSLVAVLAAVSSPRAHAEPPATAGATRQLLPDGTTLISAPLVLQGSALNGAGGREFSPAGCRILYVDNPHRSESVQGSVKVNSKVQCNARVETLSLGVNLINTTTGDRAAGPSNVTKDGAPYIDNRDTLVMCTDSRLFQFQGNAGAVSVENGRTYANLAFGNVSAPLPCGYDGA